MVTATNNRMRLDRLDDGKWLNRLLEDIQEEIAGQPSASAIERIRGNLLRRMKEPTRVAA